MRTIITTSHRQLVWWYDVYSGPKASRHVGSSMPRDSTRRRPVAASVAVSASLAPTQLSRIEPRPSDSW